MQNKTVYVSKIQSLDSNAFIDLNDECAPFITEFKHPQSLRCYSSGFKGSRKVGHTIYSKFYITTNKQKLILVQNLCFSIINIENLEIQEKFRINVSHLFFPIDSSFFTILYNAACIWCLNLITLELKLVYDSLQPINLIAISSDNQHTISYIEETHALIRHSLA